MLSAIMITLVVSSAQVAVSFHDNESLVEPDRDPRYQLYLQTVVRDTEGQLLSVSEETIAWILMPALPDGVQIPGLVDRMIDNNMVAEKEVIIIDNVKYDKLQWKTDVIIDNERLTSLGAAKVGMFSGAIWKFCGDFKQEYGNLCIPLFEGRTPQIHITEGDVITNQWTVLRPINLFFFFEKNIPIPIEKKTKSGINL